MNLPLRSEDESLSSPNRILILGCLIYFTYSVSLAVDTQFLSLYYKSKGFDGATLGVLYSLTPLTTFLTVPVWGMLTRAGGDEKIDGNGNSKIGIDEKATKRPFQILCMNIAIATICQISLAILDKPIYMMLAIIVAGLFQSPAKPMLDGIMMDHIDDHSNFGKFGFFSILGSGFGTNLGGRLLTMSQKSIMLTDNDIENIGTENFWDYISKFLSGFNLLFFARFILTIPPIICIRQLQIAATMKMKSGKNSTSNLILKGSRKAIDHHTPENNKEKSTSILSVSRDVAKHCFGDRIHFLFFLCIFIAGASGGVSDAFCCK
jgi:MFS family permease